MHPLIQVMAIIMGIYLVGFWAPRRLRRAKQEAALRLSTEEQRTAYPKSTKEETEKLMVELHEMGRSLSAKLETKILVLKELITQADQRISELQSLEKVTPQSLPKSDAENVVVEEEEKSRFEKLQEKHPQIFELAKAGSSLEEIAKKTGKPIGEIQLLVSLNPSADKKD